MQKSLQKLPPALPRDIPDYHKRQASHCRALASSAPSPALKAHLLREAAEYEKIACAETRAGFAGKTLR